MSNPETPGERARRRSRLRWVTLGEAVAIAAVLISALGLWNSYEERRDDATAKQAEADRPVSAAPFFLKAVANGTGSTLVLAPVVADQVIQGQTIRFPPALHLTPVTTTGDPRIEADWFAEALKADRKTRALPEQTAGDERLPVMIETDYLAAGRPMKARTFYDIGYALEGRFLRGSAVRLRGLSLIAHAPTSDTAADSRLTALWNARAGKTKG